MLAVYAFTVLLPLVIGFLAKTAEELIDVDTSEMMEGTNTKDHFYFAPVYVEEVRKLMPILLAEGYLD